ncbi:MAG: helix-turn-helix domain-containing protein [Proteobacteria bacterium]|nr:helix-turn-helix domain-containing protein [Pseudomonadota bacterium]
MHTVSTYSPDAAISARSASLGRSDASLRAAPQRAFAKGTEVFGEGEPSTFFYKVVSGTVRTVKLLSDGRRQIDGFYMPGDWFGLENGQSHRVTAEAVDQVLVIPYRRGDLGSLLKADPALIEALVESTLVNLDRAHEHMMLLGRKTALERMASFLMELAARMDVRDRLRLPMQRSDIADHLGLTIETVSRTVMQMVRAGLIKLDDSGRTVILADRKGLELLGA